MWSLRKGTGTIFNTAHRTRDCVRLWAAERFLPANEYTEISERYGFTKHHERCMDFWRAVKKRHPDLNIVRVLVVVL
jgi:hypothetical protein